ncbi:MAG TPA: ComF family protein [Deltaproteobacteria bacterium]|nr:ComF family protein [Deltaproteobacteria bacterium]
MFGKRLIDILVEAVFPAKCLVCASSIEKKDASGFSLSRLDPYVTIESINALKSGGAAAKSLFKQCFHGLLADMVCPACLSLFIPVHSPLCPDCGVVFQSNAGDDHQCEACIKAPKRFHKARAFGIYDQSLMELIHCFKYRGKIQLARAFGAMLLLTFLCFWNENEVDLVVPVPLHKKRFRKRGFNQSHLLIKTWESMKIASYRLPHMERDVLLRQRWTEPQTGLGRKERIRNIKDAFKVDAPDQVRRKRILLVDDVYTTGATADECSKTLLSSGAERVDVLTLARAL